MTTNRLLLLALLGACARGDEPDSRADARASPSTPAAVSSVGPVVSATPKRFASIGRVAAAAEIRAWDIDVNGSGAGLPPGRGTHARGALVFARQCAVCHGPNGEGIATNPRLIGAAAAPDFGFGRDPKLVRTIGNYWPHATTLYDYINRAMPFTAPGSLPPDDVYSVVAYLLAENGIISRTQVVDARILPDIRMPARDRFVIDDRKGGPTFR